MTSHAADTSAPTAPLPDSPAQSPLEMSNLQSSPAVVDPSPPSQSPTAAAAVSAAEPEIVPSSQSPLAQTPAASDEAQAAPAQITPTVTHQRQQTEALGPATDSPIAPSAPSASSATVLSITLMLTTGARHPYKIDEKYLKNRNVDAVAADGKFDPREMSGYKLKELIWTDWRNEWEPRPASPSVIRLIILGRLLDDKAPLKDFPFKLNDGNVVHMTVKPADLIDDDEAAGKGSGKGHALRSRDGEDRGAGCRCVIL